jgi:hypothetical protein
MLHLMIRQAAGTQPKWLTQGLPGKDRHLPLW